MSFHTEKTDKTKAPGKSSVQVPATAGAKGLFLEDNRSKTLQKKANSTGLPDNLKTGVENLSGYSMDEVKVHYNSNKPVQLQALAYAQGTDIHLAHGQEKHLPHEAWHVVQQKQGRVKPTLQMKTGVNVNDDKGLEHEADVMGGKALQLKDTDNNHTGKMSSSNYGTTVQREIIVGGQALNIYDALDRIKNDGIKFNDEQRMALTYGILPAYNAHRTSFLNNQDLTGRIGQILRPYTSLYHTSGYKDFAHYLHNQRASQTAVYGNQALYQHLLTTAGFEHEFADMKNSPLKGVSHIVIAKSIETLPYTGIKFLVETDASNALELVSPPFLFPTTNGSTIPMSGKIKEVDNLMKWALVTILTDKIVSFGPDIYSNRKYVDRTLTDIIAGLDRVTGLHFHLKNNIKLKSGHLSHKANLNTLAPHLVPSPANANQLILDANNLANTAVGKSVKGNDSYSISSQVNFATTIAATKGIQTYSNVYGAQVHQSISARLRELIPVPPNSSTELTDFYPIMIPKLAGLFSVYSQTQVRNTQAVLHADLLSKVTPNAQNQDLAFPTPAARKEFGLHAVLLSYVKDITPSWLKDHVLSVAEGMLQPADYPVLLTALQAVDLSAYTLPDNIDNHLRDQGHTTTAAHWTAFILEVQNAIATLAAQIQQRINTNNAHALADTKPNVPIYGHDPQYIGVRQDTYQNPANIRMQHIHPNKKLHLVEIRRGDPSESIADLETGL